MKPEIGKRYRWSNLTYQHLPPFRVTAVDDDRTRIVYDDGIECILLTAMDFDDVASVEEVAEPQSEKKPATDGVRSAAVLLVALMSRIQNAAALGIDLGLTREKFCDMAGDCYDAAEALIADAERQLRAGPGPAR